jgi:hypothetical protein
MPIVATGSDRLAADQHLANIHRFSRRTTGASARLQGGGTARC